MITFDDVQRAAERLEGVAHRTPVLTGRSLDEATNTQRVLLKAENLQRVGAFKFRGAYNAVASLSSKERANGVATVSSGNHAQALSLAARLHEAPAVILMPEDAPPGKLNATRGYGAEVVLFDRYGEDREALLAALVEERGLVPIHPYDDERVMAGQGTATLELIEDAGPLDVLLVPLGGGGLLSGAATAARALSPDMRVIGVEPEAGDDFKRSLAAGERVRIEVPRTIADGQQLPMPGELTFPVIQQLVDEVVTVSDAEIVDAMRLLFERAKTVVEPSGASAFAALLAGRVDAKGLRVGVDPLGRQRDRRALRGARLTATALALVLTSAALHAGWNALIASAKDTHATTAVALIAGALVFAVPAALTWRIEAEAWPYIAASAALELAYFALLAAVYQRADYSFAYPVARGSAPVIVLLVSVTVLGVPVGLAAAAGVLAVTAGVLLVRGIGRAAPDTASLALALGVGACIAGYTLSDDHGVRHAAALPYFEVVLVLSALPYVAAVTAIRGPAALRAAVDRRSVPAGVAMVGAYVLVLAALERAEAAPVAALRETSVVMAAVGAAIVGRERVPARRIAGAVLVVAGVALIAV